MAVIICASATGSPGVTTTALGLALRWPQDVLLADCDRDPAQVVQAGYLRGVDMHNRGLLAVSYAHRENRPLINEVWNQAVPLTQNDEQQRRYLPGFTHPGSAELFIGVWADLGRAFAELAASGVDVIIDIGRIGREGIPRGLLEVADAVLVFTLSSLRSLAALRLHIPALLNSVSTSGGHGEVGLVLVGQGRPYSVNEVATQFELPVWASIAYDPSDALVLSDGAVEPRNYNEGTFTRSLITSAAAISQRIAANAQERWFLGGQNYE
ncbi:MAG: hypothetical protein CR979_02650 [Propionibacterium sp.]|nr:MAG: hypothetical protein CR979_02650 [Propionibacterium sp.]